MHFSGLKTLLSAFSLLLLWLLASPAVHAGVSYNFQVRPLLAGKCFSCHGADAAKRKGELRLDVREAALESKAFLPGDAERSEIIQRIISTDPDEVMPPPAQHAPLSAAELTLLKQWITEGAQYEAHWAFVPPQKPAVPVVVGVSSAIDALVRAPLLQRGLPSAAEAEASTWLRRVSFALTGLPPTPAEVQAFMADTSEAAYQRVVDQLLRSPRYGEQMAVGWLDAARFGDTYGRHEDSDCTVWPWRDWVIQAFNENLPYDKFIQWQMAGDMLPGATQEQVVATAFHRLTVQSNEAGADPEEYRWEQVFDRVKTTATAVMGLTMECARCHDHKYDPITMRDYYGMAAFLNNIDELGLFARYSTAAPTPSALVYKRGEAQKHTELKQAVVVAEQRYAEALRTAPERYTEWLKKHAPPGSGRGLWAQWQSGRQLHTMPQPELYVSFDSVDAEKKLFRADSDPKLKTEGGVMTGAQPAGYLGRGAPFQDKNKRHGFPGVAHYLRSTPFSFSLWLQCEKPLEKAVVLHRTRGAVDAAHKGYEITFEDGLLTATLAHFYPGDAIRIQAKQRIDFSQWQHIGLSYDGSSRAAGLRLYLNGELLETQVIRDHLTRDIDYLKEWGELDAENVADVDAARNLMLWVGGRVLDASLHDAVVDELRAYDVELTAAEMRTLGSTKATTEQDWLAWYAREKDELCRKAQAELTAARKAENDFNITLTEMMVMAELPGARRPMPMLGRGDFRSPGELVEPATPGILPSMDDKLPRDRAGLAAWLTQPRHPLTARVQVNRIWAQFFGRGIVATAEDFGLQGSVPTHPELLDWLAVHFVESGWDMKALCREIALSKTFRQSSIPATAEVAKADPENLLLTRGPAFRLSAEQLRDAALYASGLMKGELGGQSVKPYQPEGLWEESGTQHDYKQDHGDKLYRRSLYTFWRRTCPPPVLSTLDAPTREFCRVRREATMTPLQSLALMNDTGFLECARVLAERLVQGCAGDAAARVQQAFLALTGHAPTAAQSQAMVQLMEDARGHYTSHPDEAKALLEATGESPLTLGLSPTEVASTLLMTRALLGSDAFVTAD